MSKRARDWGDKRDRWKDPDPPPEPAESGIFYA